MPSSAVKKATSTTPQVVTLIIDDSMSMREPVTAERSKADIATASIRSMVITAQAINQGGGQRFLMNLAKFGDTVTPIVEADLPKAIPLPELYFSGSSGKTNMALALEWAASALKKALAKCRTIQGFDEQRSPSPLVVFLTDGENTGPDIQEAARHLHAIPFADGRVDVVACGIGLLPEHFFVIEQIASRKELAFNVAPAQLAKFLAEVGATFVPAKPTSLSDLTNQFRPDDPPIFTETVIGPIPGVAVKDVFATSVPAKPTPLPNLTKKFNLDDSGQTADTEPVIEAVPVVPVIDVSPAVVTGSHGTGIANEIKKIAIAKGWDHYTAKGKEALAAGNYEKAETDFLAALDEVKATADERTVSSLSNLSMLYTRRGDWRKAAPFAEGAMQLLSQLGNSTALEEGLRAAEMLAELMTLVDERQSADTLWKQVAGMGGNRDDAGRLTAAGFVNKAQGRALQAEQDFRRAIDARGVGSVAALKGIIEVKNDREATESYLEQLEEEMARRFGVKHAASRKVYADLRFLYAKKHKEKIPALDKKYQ